MRRMSKGKKSHYMSRVEGLRADSDQLGQDPSRCAIVEDHRVKSSYKRASKMKESMGRHDLYEESALDSRLHVLPSFDSATDKETNTIRCAFDWDKEADAPLEDAYKDQISNADEFKSSTASIRQDSRTGKTGEAVYEPIMNVSTGPQSNFEPVSDEEKLFYAYDISKDDDMTFADLEEQIDRLRHVVDLNTSITIPSNASNKKSLRPAFDIMQHLLWRIKREEQRADALMDRIDEKRCVLEKLQRDFHAELQRQAASIERRLSKNVASLSDTSSDAFANATLPPRGRSFEQHSDAVSEEMLARPKTKHAGSPLQEMLLSRDSEESSHGPVVTEIMKPVNVVGRPSASALPLTTVLDRVREIISDCHIKSMPRLYL